MRNWDIRLHAAEGHAALAAVEWAVGNSAKAESEYDRATQLDPSLQNMTYVRQNTRWPPALYDAFEKLLRLELADVSG